MAQRLVSSSQTFSQFIRPMSLLSYTSKLNTDCIWKKKYWSIENKKNRMQWQLFPSSWCYWHSFFWQVMQNALSLVAGNQVQIIHLIQLQQSMIYPTNEPSCEPSCEPTKRIDLNAELPNNLSAKWVKYSLSQKQDAELPSKITDKPKYSNLWAMPQ